MSHEENPPQRIAVIWSQEARADVRAINRETALQILHCLDRYLLNSETEDYLVTGAPRAVDTIAADLRPRITGRVQALPWASIGFQKRGDTI